MSKDGFNASDGERSMTKSERRLVAIMSADVESFSRLMSDDELTTVRTLKHYRGIMARFIQQYGGRIVDSPGNNCLAEFEVQSAQSRRLLKSRNH
jgi:class 3 adenylate cyclase